MTAKIYKRAKVTNWTDITAFYWTKILRGGKIGTNWLGRRFFHAFKNLCLQTLLECNESTENPFPSQSVLIFPPIKMMVQLLMLDKSKI